MAVALLVVEDRTALQRVLDARERPPAPRRARRRSRRRARARSARCARRLRCAPRGTSSASLVDGDRGSPAARAQHARATSSAVSACSAYTRTRESSAPLTSNAGFSVVAPISVSRPSSTAGSSASCWALLKRWISSRNSTVCVAGRSRRCAARSITARTSARPGLDRAQLLEGRLRVLGDDPRERRLARARRAVEDHRVGLALLDRGAQRGALAAAGAPGRRTPRRPARPHARGQRRGSRRGGAAAAAVGPASRLLGSGLVEQGCPHAAEYRIALRVGRSPGQTGRLSAVVVEVTWRRVVELVHPCTVMTISQRRGAPPR